MSIQSNINLYYTQVVKAMKERKQAEIEEEPDIEPYEAEARALDNGLMYYVDQAYVVAQALLSGRIEWGKEVDWQDVYDMLIEDMNSEE